MEKVCPRCTSVFNCYVNKIELCHCKKITLVQGVREHIKDTYGNCLCADCLKTINDSFESHKINTK